MKKIEIGEYLAKLRARTWLSHALSSSLAAWWPDAQSARDNHVLACNLTKYSPILIFFTDRLSNKRFLICLLIPLHLKYIATLPCNRLFSDITVSHSSVAYCKFTKKSSSKKIVKNRLNLTELWP